MCRVEGQISSRRQVYMYFLLVNVGRQILKNALT